MGQLLLITDDPGRSAGLAGGLEPSMPCRIHDLGADAIPAEPVAALVTDVADLGPGTLQRLRRLLAHARHGVPLVVLLHRDSPHARLQAVALGATLTLSAPFDLRLIQAALAVPDAPAAALDSRAKRQAEAARQFYRNDILILHYVKKLKSVSG